MSLFQLYFYGISDELVKQSQSSHVKIKGVWNNPKTFSLFTRFCFVWMFALGGWVLYWIECLILLPMILILRLNVNISVWVFRYFELRLDIEVGIPMLFGWSKRGLVVPATCFSPKHTQGHDLDRHTPVLSVSLVL
jgi:hypothetical protein